VIAGRPEDVARGPLVYKFGGSSVGDAARLRHVASLVAAAPDPPVVVVSALDGTTDTLVEAARLHTSGGDITPLVQELRRVHRSVANELAGDDERLAGRLTDAVDQILSSISGEPGSARGSEAEDRIRAAGEDLAALLLAGALEANGHPAEVVDARLLIRTDACHGAATPEEPAIRVAAEALILPRLGERRIVVTQGFVGATAAGATTTLGRGGSDLSASLIGAAIGAREVHIWTDVEGVLSGDPRTVANPRILDELGFEEAVELAYFGANVLHAGAAKHAVSRGLDVRIRSTFAPERPGTRILRDRWGAPEIAAVAFKRDVALIQVRSHPSAIPYGFLARVFDVLTRHRLPVDLVATSHTSTAFTLDAAAEISAAAQELGLFADVAVRTGLATITVVGHGLLEEPGVGARVFQVVDRTPVHLVSQASNVSLSFVVDADAAPTLVRRLHQALIECRP
jgi:aspartate kinase